METYLGEDVDELCRLCLSKDEIMVPIHDDDAVPLPLRIMACIDLEVRILLLSTGKSVLNFFSI